MSDELGLPTAADMSRDAAADMAACEAATPGPWRPEPCAEDLHGEALWSLWHRGECALMEGADRPRTLDEPPDILFARTAREAMPAWIRRAEHLREENARLWAALEAAYSRQADGDVPPHSRAAQAAPSPPPCHRAAAGLEAAAQGELLARLATPLAEGEAIPPCPSCGGQGWVCWVSPEGHCHAQGHCRCVGGANWKTVILGGGEGV